MGKAELTIQIDADLLAQAEATGRDITYLVEDALRAALGPPGMAEAATEENRFAGMSAADEAKARRWAEENAEALKAQRERIDAYGVFGEDLRTW
jgi:antitoxin CcdA